MPILTKSLREFLLGQLVDFASDCEIEKLATATTLTNLVVTLSDLREEGATLLPEVYLCNDIDSALKLLPIKEILPIGKQEDPSRAIAEALKKCAPLAIEGWCIYISGKDNFYSFGLFRGSLYPLSIATGQTLLSEPRDQMPLVRITRTASRCVELKNHKGHVYSMLLNDKPATAPLPQAFTTDLVNLICKSINDSAKEASYTYLKKTISTALNSCHGTLIAVTKSKKIPKFLSDGVMLKEPLDIAAAVNNLLQENSSSNSEHTLNAFSSLIRGMISSDGITVFSKTGHLIAYNCFIKTSNTVNGKVVIGGARTRAYESLKCKVGKDIEGVFIQSQDGWTKFTGTTNDI